MSDLMRIAVVGSVDHGKSTLIARLLSETGSLPTGKVEEVQQAAAARRIPFEWSFVLDALKVERDQAVTVDTTQVRFRGPLRGYLFIDTPGHAQFLRNMVSGASQADAAILIVDAEEGPREQTARHLHLLDILGIRNVIVAMNKMDRVDFAISAYRDLSVRLCDLAHRRGLNIAATVPIAARDGDNLISSSARMPWYDGPTLVAALGYLPRPALSTDGPLRLPIQDVYRIDGRRVLVGRIESGAVRVGDDLLFSPSNRTARVATIEGWNTGPITEMAASANVGLTLEEQIFVERGELASHGKAPPFLTDVFRARLFWLSDAPLRVGQEYRLRIATREVRGVVEKVQRTIDVNNGMEIPDGAVEQNSIADVIVRTRELIAVDPSDRCAATGRFVICDAYNVLGGGLVSMSGYPDQRQVLTIRSSNLTPSEHRITSAARTARNGHSGAVIWLTGLPAAGKSTIAMMTEAELFRRGYLVYVLDGDNLRRGLNADLDFSPEARSENIRRIGEVAKLFAEAGMVVITAFISPYRSDRARARRAAGGQFHEIYVRASLGTCERRDPKGLYQRARKGEIPDFTGVSSPYEDPLSPELVLDTERSDAQSCVGVLVDYIKRVTSGA